MNMTIQSVGTSLPIQGSSESLLAPAALREKKDSPLVQGEVPVKQPVSQEELKTAVQSVKEYIKPFNNNLEFSVSDETEQVVIKVVDSTTKELIRQIPSEEMLAIAKALDSLKGLFVKQQA